MSDEESFVILDNNADPLFNSEYALEHDGLSNSQRTLKSIDLCSSATSVGLDGANKSSLQLKMAEAVVESPNKTEQQQATAVPNAKDDLIWKTSIINDETNAKPNSASTSLNACNNEKEATSMRSNGTNCSGDEPSNLATSFLLGEVNADVLKNSVYSQFPSLCSMQACAEDVIKLQNLLTEYIDLKRTLSKVNQTMKQYYDTTRKWQEDAVKQEQIYQSKLSECQTEITKLRNENKLLRDDLANSMDQFRITEEIRQKDHDELTQNISEKASLINNMRVEINKLNQQQLQSYEFLPSKSDDTKPLTDHVEREEHNRVIKDFERRISTLLAENLEVKDMQNTYLDEINCLKVNLTCTEELLHKTNADVTALNATITEHAEELAVLRQQVDIYRKDFEVERAEREKIAGEKELYLQDLRSLQRRNQELIESLAEANKANRPIIPQTSIFGKASLRENQRPVRVLDPTGAAARTSPTKESRAVCPVCSKTFPSLNVLQSHINDCLDSN